MKLKKSIITAFAAVGLIASIAAPAAMAQTQLEESTSANNSTTASVVVTSTGEFDVYFNVSSFDLSGATLSASSPEGAAAGSFTVFYTDSLADRPNFTVTLSASDFYLSGSTLEMPPTISNAGFTIDRTYSVRQDQSGSTPYEIGDIGYYVNDAYPADSPPNQAASTAWTANNALDTARTIHFGEPGVGTIASDGLIDVALDVPAGTSPGTYQSMLTLTVYGGFFW